MGCDKNTSEQSPHNSNVSVAGSVNDWQQLNIQSALLATASFHTATNRFINEPNQETLQNWRLNWQDCHDKVIVALLLAPNKRRASTIDPWPIEPGFLDSLPEYDQSGIINDETLAINDLVLKSQHQITDVSEVALGLHVLEYYAFARLLSDFEPHTKTALRRSQLILSVSSILTEDLRQLDAQDSPLKFTELSILELIQLLELRSQHIFSEFNLIADHSPFSGRPHHDVKIQLHGIKDLLAGTVRLNDRLNRIDPQLTTNLNRVLDSAITILGGQELLSEAANAQTLLLISAISDQLDDLARALQSQLRENLSH